jgi:hypothetical protein
VHVEQDRSARAGGVATGKDDRRPAGFPPRHRQPALLEHRGEKVGILDDVAAIGGEIRHRHQPHELGEDLTLGFRTPLAHAQHACGRSGKQ